MSPEAIIALLVGTGMIAGMWRLTREVASLAESMKHYARESDDHEVRIRSLENLKA